MRAGATSHNAIAAKLNERNVRTARGGTDAVRCKSVSPTCQRARNPLLTEDGPNPLGFLFNDNDLAVLGLVSERRHAPDPKPLALGGSDLVSNEREGVSLPSIKSQGRTLP